MSEQTTLDTAFIKQGIDYVSFWNGRVLTAEDLSDEQHANDAGRRRLGRAVGSGIGHGLTVAGGPADNQVTVAAGVAINGLGQALELPVDIEVALTVPIAGISGTGVFAQCDDVPSATPAGGGLYMLVLRPASDSKGEAPGVAANGNGVGTECGPRYSVDGVSFRLIGLDASGLAADQFDAADLAVLAGSQPALERNVVAQLFLNSIARRALLEDPFSAAVDADYGVMADLADTVVADCEVPLALVSWSSGRVEFVDAWPVRRPLMSQVASASAVEALSGPRLRVEGAATFRQFQEQLAAIVSELSTVALAGFSATTRFRYLPAVGLVPLAEDTSAGFDQDAFLVGMTVRTPVAVSAGQVGPLLDASFAYPPIDVDSGEVVYVYTVRRQFSNGGNGADPAYMIFCSSQLPFLGDELRIDAVFPAGLLHLDQRIEIRGGGFGVSTGDARITFDGQNANALPGSTDTKIIVDVPTTLAVSAEGTEVTLRVSKSESEFDSVPVTVRTQPQTPVGDIHVFFDVADPAVVTAGEALLLHLRVESGVTGVNDFVVAANSEPATPIVLLDEALDPLPDPITLDLGDEVVVIASIDEVPDVATFSVTLEATSAGLTGKHILALDVGEEVPESDPDIVIRSNTITLEDSSQGSHDGNTTINLPVGFGALVELFVDLTAAGDYDVSLVPTQAELGWTGGLVNPADGVFDGIVSETETAAFTVVPLAGSTDVTMALRVQRQGSDLFTEKIFELNVVRP